MTEATHTALVEYARGGGHLVYLQADPAEAMERARRGRTSHAVGRCGRPVAATV